MCSVGNHQSHFPCSSAPAALLSLSGLRHLPLCHGREVARPSSGQYPREALGRPSVSCTCHRGSSPPCNLSCWLLPVRLETRRWTSRESYESYGLMGCFVSDLQPGNLSMGTDPKPLACIQSGESVPQQSFLHVSRRL